MAYQLSSEAFDAWLGILWQQGQVYGPKRFEKAGAFSDTDRYNYGEIRSLTDLVTNQKTYLSPKEMAFPTRETLFFFNEDSVTVPKVETTPIYIFLRPCDVHGFDRLDHIFLKNGPFIDPYYENRRKRLRFILMACGDENKGFETCFCVSMGTNETDQWHANLKLSGDTAYIGLNAAFEQTDLYRDLEDTLSKASPSACPDSENVSLFTPEFVKENTISVAIPDVGSLSNEIFDHPIWQEYTARCIACGRCNTSCVTCSCFTMQDVKHSEHQGERRRRWASCHVKGYSDMAGGHSFRGKNGERMRFKTMHKINDFHKRFDKHMCVGCGRCDDVCPEYISFSKCINKLDQIVKTQGGQSHE